MTKISTQLAVIVCVGIAGLVTMVVFLSRAGWSEGGIAGLVTGLGTVFATVAVTIRNQQKAADSLELLQRQIGAGQRDTSGLLHVVREQTNGPTEQKQQDIAERAIAGYLARTTGQAPQ